MQTAPFQQGTVPLPEDQIIHGGVVQYTESSSLTWHCTSSCRPSYQWRCSTIYRQLLSKKARQLFMQTKLSMEVQYNIQTAPVYQSTAPLPLSMELQYNIHTAPVQQGTAPLPADHVIHGGVVQYTDSSSLARHCTSSYIPSYPWRCSTIYRQLLCKKALHLFMQTKLSMEVQYNIQTAPVQ